MDPKPQGSWLTFEFAVHGLMIPTLGLVGIVGNVCILIVLSKRVMRNNINCLLIGLASIDISLIVCALALFTFPAFVELLKVRIYGLRKSML